MDIERRRKRKWREESRGCIYRANLHYAKLLEATLILQLEKKVRFWARSRGVMRLNPHLSEGRELEETNPNWRKLLLILTVEGRAKIR